MGRLGGNGALVVRRHEGCLQGPEAGETGVDARVRIAACQAENVSSGI
jgi:hypothetical protein